MATLIARIENYKMGQIGGVGKEQEREEKYINTHYNNPDWDKDKVDQNVTLIHDPERDGKSWERYIKEYKDNHNIGGRFNISCGGDKNQTNVATQFLVTVSDKNYFENDREGTIQFFKDACKSLQSMYPSYHFCEATIHFDERTPHMHALALPLYNDPQKGITTFNTTKTQPGKEHFREFQDRFYRYMSHYYDLDRGVRGSDREHLSVKAYKQLQREKELLRGEKEVLQEEKEALQQEKEQYAKPVPTKTILGKRYKPAEVEKVVEERNIAYQEIERLERENTSLQRTINSMSYRQHKLEVAVKDASDHVREVNQLLNNRDYLKEQLKELEREERRAHQREQKERDMDRSR